jgi:hypothetical protein
VDYRHFSLTALRDVRIRLRKVFEYAGINSSFLKVRGTDNFLTEGILYFSLSIIAQVIEYPGERHSHFPDISSKFCAAFIAERYRALIGFC